ncbi:MAG TPA: cupin domain-containing protein [Pseudobacteroides sp.]|nr:cupin domain-containing protein [Pseudobacteroides sp.]
MIRRGSEMVKEIKEQMRGGKGSVEITHFFSQDEIKGKARLIAKISLNPGCSIGVHEHVNEEEIYYILKGKALVDDNGKKYELNAGDASLTLGGESHLIENIGDEVLEFVAVILLYA